MIMENKPSIIKKNFNSDARKVQPSPKNLEESPTIKNSKRLFKKVSFAKSKDKNTPSQTHCAQPAIDQKMPYNFSGTLKTIKEGRSKVEPKWPSWVLKSSKQGRASVVPMPVHAVEVVPNDTSEIMINSHRRDSSIATTCHLSDDDEEYGPIAGPIIRNYCEFGPNSAEFKESLRSNIPIPSFVDSQSQNTIINLAADSVNKAIKAALLNVNSAAADEADEERNDRCSSSESRVSSIPSPPPLPAKVKTHIRMKSTPIIGDFTKGVMSARASLRHVSAPSMDRISLSSASFGSTSEDEEEREKVVNDIYDLMRLNCLKAKEEEFEGGKYLGRGKSASVRIASDRSGSKIALKEFCFLKKEPPLAVLKGFLLEADIMKHLSGCPNIVQLYGMWLEPKPTLVMELLEDGSLYNALFPRDPNNSTSVAWRTAAPSKRLDIIHQASLGLQAMHRNNVVHRDIKSHNIVISLKNDNWEAKIADFGSAVKLGESGRTTGGVGTSGYSAPEIFKSLPYGLQCDIFSFAILVWEAGWTGENAPNNPLQGLFEEEYVSLVSWGLRPSLMDKNCFGIPQSEYISLIEKMWATEPAERPTAEEVPNLVEDFI